MSLMRIGLAVCGLALAGILACADIAAAQDVMKSPTMDAIKKRDQVICGIDTGIPGYAFQDSKGEWQGLDVAYCRAIADALAHEGVPAGRIAAQGMGESHLRVMTGDGKKEPRNRRIEILIRPIPG